MTNQPDLNAIGEAFAKFTEAFAEMTFGLAAQGALGQLLRGANHDQLRTRLARFTTSQLEKVGQAAHDLRAITDGILEDREAAQEAAGQTEETVATEGNQP